LTALVVILSAQATDLTSYLRALQRDRPGLRITLGMVSAQPGTEVRVPLKIFSEGQVSVGKLQAKVRFNHRWLTFKAIETLESETVAIDCKVEKDPNSSDLSILRLEISPTQGGTSIGSDSICEILFAVAEDVPDGEMVSLEIEASAVTAGDPPEQIQGLKLESGAITVLGPVFGCMFYMH